MSATRWAYLLIYSPELASFEQMQTYLNRESDVLHWYAVFPNSFFIISPAVANALANKLGNHFGHTHPFLIVDVDSDKAGLVPQDLWNFMKEKPSFRDEKSAATKSMLDTFTRYQENEKRKNKEGLSAMLRALEKTKPRS